MRMKFSAALAGLALAFSVAASALAAPPAPATQDWTIRDFRFRSGETLPELRIRYHTLGQPHRNAAGEIDNAVMVLHGTGGSGRQFLQPQFADVLFRPGGLLDPAKYFIILPDNIGHGGSSKPSDGLRAKFPKYDYADMVQAQHRLVTEKLGVRRLRLIMGTSMGCMHGFMWAEQWPDGAKALMPMACQPVEIAGRNRLWRRMAIDAITTDPAYRGGDYETQPVQGLRSAVHLLLLAGSAPIQMQASLPTREAADAWLAAEVPRRVAAMDANDFVWQVASSRTYDPSKDLEKITAPMTWVNSADDFINPPELGIAEAAARRLKTTRYVLLPASDRTRGHGSHTWAELWQAELADLLQRSE
ncbi:homoserine O-acetyltransferase [Phenylobacterium zucineum HLK1]|uniref:Homoserine O-acetyltransferase n=2 Tax=Phenylobacterium zucineum TaxID=284016 RepID=B4RHA9_PHEZH|nr:homoserine O-acetyltransferase [Phenylobacterium zucineum HLK1]